MAGELDPVGAERVGFDQFSPGGNVRSVNFLDDPRLRQVELVEGALEADAPGVKLRAHGAIAQERAPAKPLEERMDAGFAGFGGGTHGAQ